MKALEHVAGASGGAWRLGSWRSAAEVDSWLRRAGWSVRRIDGRNCPDKPALLRVLAAELELPGYFGHNWDALTDSLRDTVSARGRLAIVVRNANEVGRLSPDGEILTTLAGIVDDLHGEGVPVKLVACSPIPLVGVAEP